MACIYLVYNTHKDVEILPPPVLSLPVVLFWVHPRKEALCDCQVVVEVWGAGASTLFFLGI